MKVSNASYQGSPLSFSVSGGRFDQIGVDITGEDWSGRHVMPGFVDSHCHILPTGLDLLKLHLGACQSQDDILQAVKERSASLEPGEWLLAVHYDQTKWPGAAHLSRHQLDGAVPDRPVLLRHSNGHASVANSAALEAASIPPDVVDPDGGTFERDSAGQLTGVLLERAHERVTSAAPHPTLDQMVEAILRAGERMSAFGITAATDMMTGRWNLDRELHAYTLAASKGCNVRLRLCLQWASVLGKRGIESGRLRELESAMEPGSCAIWGLKVFADGAIGSATAAIHGKFLTTGGNGQLIYSEEKLAQIIADIDASGYRCAVHSIGDRSTDLVLDAYEKTADPSRHRIEHVMILSDGQIQRLKKIGCRATMQPEFLVRFGHAYKAQLPAEVACRLKRARSVIDAGIDLSFSSDAPIVTGNPWDGIRTAVSRPEGFDPAENVTMQEAIDAYTVRGARANDDGHQGAFEVGNRADFQVYDGPPNPSASPVAVFKGGELVSGDI